MRSAKYRLIKLRDELRWYLDPDIFKRQIIRHCLRSGIRAAYRLNRNNTARRGRRGSVTVARRLGLSAVIGVLVPLALMLVACGSKPTATPRPTPVPTATAATPFSTGVTATPSPSSIQQETATYEREVKDATTDSEGKVSFIDNSTGEPVSVQVVDEDQSPLSGVEVTYFDGEGYEVFTTVDPSNRYLPSIGIYLRKSDHVIETKRLGNGVYQIHRIEDAATEIAAWKWKHENGMGWDGYTYVRTIDHDEKIEMQENIGWLNDLLFKSQLFFIGGWSSVSPSELVSLLAPEEENPPQRFDIYSTVGSNRGGLGFSVVPSNIPEVEISALKIIGDEVAASWVGTDRDTYAVRVALPSNQDLTKYMDGNDRADFAYSFHLLLGDGVYDGHGWTKYSENTSVSIGSLPAGTYTLEVMAKDEVGNVGLAKRAFAIEDTPSPSERRFLPPYGYEVGYQLGTDDGKWYLEMVEDSKVVCDFRVAMCPE